MRRTTGLQKGGGLVKSRANDDFMGMERDGGRRYGFFVLNAV